MTLIRVLLIICWTSFVVGLILLKVPKTKDTMIPKILGYLVAGSFFSLVALSLWKMWSSK